MNFGIDLACARRLDNEDELSPYRDRFVIDDPDLIYVDGNSLGRLPKSTKGRMQEVIESEWGFRLIRGWNEGWFDLPMTVGAKLAPLIGAHPEEIILADATSINLFKLVMAALEFKAGRTRIITDDLNFPSDLYILQGACKLFGGNVQLEIIPSADGIHGPEEAILAALDDDVALVTLAHTAFKSAFTYDMAAITEAAHRVGAMVLWDTSHSVGALPIDLSGCEADLAVGCTYKYLNGGPGSPAFLYVRKDLQSHLRNPITGWMGQLNPFDFDLDYRPADGLRQFLTGTPSILSLSAAETGIEMTGEAGLNRLRAKSIHQSEYFISLWRQLLAPLGFHLHSPSISHRRGSHVTLGHDHGWPIAKALIEEMKVLPDFRAPDNIRVGIAPLYNSFVDLYETVDRLRIVVEDGLYRRYKMATAVVT